MPCLDTSTILQVTQPMPLLDVSLQCRLLCFPQACFWEPETVARHLSRTCMCWREQANALHKDGCIGLQAIKSCCLCTARSPAAFRIQLYTQDNDRICLMALWKLLLGADRLGPPCRGQLADTCPSVMHLLQGCVCVCWGLGGGGGGVSASPSGQHLSTWQDISPSLYLHQAILHFAGGNP